MTTALDIITSAMKRLGVIRKSETPTADEAVDALVSLNDMAASWSNDTLLITSRVRESFLLLGGASYTIGTGQTLDTTRPINIIDAFIRTSTDGIDHPLSIINDEQYDLNIPLKTAGEIPYLLNYNNAYPYGTIRLYPVPAGGYYLHLLSEKPLTEFSALSTNVDLPAGWRMALIDNLALELAPDYGIKVDRDLSDRAAKSLGAIKRAVARYRTSPLVVESGVQGNVFSGWYYR